VDINSPPVEFDVISGVRIWEQAFGLPENSPTNHSPPEVRKYILQRAAYLEHLRLYLRVTDESESTIFKVRSIGPMTSFTEPITRLDSRNNLHLLYLESARTYRYAVVDPDGEIVKRRQYYYVDRPAKLTIDEHGEVSVVGAMRHITADDFPPPPPDEATNSVTGVQP